MKLITITVEVDDEAKIRNVRDGSAIPLATIKPKAKVSRWHGEKPVVTPTGRYPYPSAAPEAVAETASGKMVRAFFAKRTRSVTTAVVGKLFEKKGLSKNTATPVLSALVRTGHVVRVKPGVFAPVPKSSTEGSN
jgi:hypothetical protein